MAEYESVNQGNSPTPAGEWRGRKGTPLPLPSGNTALVRSPGMQHFLKSGSLPNSLRSLIQRAMSGSEKEKLDEILSEETNLEELLQLFDNILLQVVIEPEVRSIPKWTEIDVNEERCSQGDIGHEIPLDQRDQSVIYVDEVDMEDKAFIFQYAVGGTKDLESFRKEQESTLAVIQSSQDVEL